MRPETRRSSERELRSWCGRADVVAVARPRKWRCVHGPARPRMFKPAGVPARELEVVVLTLDGLEALRLLDLEGLRQEEAATELGVSRSTVSRLAAEARRSVAEALVGGKALVIEGGPAAVARRASREVSTTTGGESMIIAVPYDEGQVNGHFGRTEAFLIARAEGSELKESTVYDVVGLQHNHSGLAGFLASRGVEVILAGGMGPPMQQALRQAGFSLYTGVSGSAAGALETFLSGTLEQSDAACSHHGEAHGHDHQGGGQCGDEHQHDGGCAH
ncbi:MAG TPA: DUF134 domain-containing protein [Thermoleophilia bacterium]|nr:DUF134 domain-containing protein [Thermoleophilia bacterium]